MIDRKTFFDQVRPSVFKRALNQGQVEGTNIILDEWERRRLTDPRWLAYMLATAYHETARTMQPIKEYGKGKGRKYGAKDKTTGQVYYGRGFVQLTWAANYKRMGKLLGVPLYENPDLALQPAIAAGIMFEGMLRAESFKGDFTGKCLEDYFTATKTDWINARRIINGLDRASLIAGYARAFHAAILSASTPFKSPQALTRSRTMQAAVGSGSYGAGQTAYSGYELVDAATSANEHITAGDIFGLVIGLAIAGFALYAAYARWDDAGRPSLREIFRRQDAEA